jgi:hypothetical protein
MVSHMQVRAPSTSNPLSLSDILVRAFFGEVEKVRSGATILPRPLRFCQCLNPAYRLKLV